MTLKQSAGPPALAILLVVAGMMFGQCRARYTDVSGNVLYAARVGQRCTVLKELRAHGFTLDLRRKDLTHEVDVTTLPGVGGPEITFVVPIPQGSTIVVTGVRKCWNCLSSLIAPFGLGTVDYAVTIPDSPQLANYRVFARSSVFVPDEVRCDVARR